MSDYSFVTIDSREGLTIEMATQLFELDRQFFPTPWTLNSWKELFFHNDRYLVLLNSGNQFIGFCLFERSVQDSFAHLLKVLIHPQFRNNGLSKKILNTALDDFKKNGIQELYLEVEEDNAPAQKLYLSIGFKVIHSKKDFYGTNRSALIMAKSLTRQS